MKNPSEEELEEGQETTAEAKEENFSETKPKETEKSKDAKYTPIGVNKTSPTS